MRNSKGHFGIWKVTRLWNMKGQMSSNVEDQGSLWKNYNVTPYELTSTCISLFVSLQEDNLRSFHGDHFGGFASCFLYIFLAT